MANLFQLGPELSDRQRRKDWVIVALFGAFVAAALLWSSSPVDGVVLCPFRRLTGLSCFGCGMTRACVNVMHGNLWASVKFHPFGILFVIGFGATALLRLAQNLVGHRIEYPGRAFWKRKDNPVLIGCLLILGLFGVLRLILEWAGFLTPI